MTFVRICDRITMGYVKELIGWPRAAWVLVGMLGVVVGLTVPTASAVGPEGEVTFAKDIAPILQRSCQNCHRPDSVAPMSLITYEEVRPFARAIKQQTLRRQMPPWYIEKHIGIQKFQDDQSLSDEEIAKIAKWSDSGAPLGNPADMPPPLAFSDSRAWRLGKPDLIISSPDITVEAAQPDWWGPLGDTKSGLTEDRYIKAVETLEVNDIPSKSDGGTVDGRFLIHHAAMQFLEADGTPQVGGGYPIPVHEIGRNADVFDPDAGRPIKAGTIVSFNNTHLHANGRRSKTRLDLGLWFHPRGYTPKYKVQTISWGAVDLDVKGNQANQVVEAFYTVPQPIKLLNYEPHMHAAGVRMCLEAILGAMRQTLNCAGYNHNWVRSYTYAPDSTPLLPAGTILHLVGYNDTTPGNRNVLDYRNWSGWGHRAVDNMFINIAFAVFLTGEQFADEVAKRREKLSRGEGELVGCLTCGVAPGALAKGAIGAR